MTARVMMVIPTLVQGGAEKQMSLLAAGLPKEDFEVSVCVLTHSGPWQSFLESQGIPVTIIHKRFKLDPIALARLTSHMKKERPDLIHTWIFAANSYGRVAARLAGVPHVLAGERCVDLWKSEGHFWIDRKLAASTDGLVTNSQGVVDFYREHGLPESQFHVIPNGIDVSEFREVTTEQSRQRRMAARKQWLNELNLDDSARLLVCVSRLWPQKRLKDMIWALDLANCSEDHLHLVIAGEGPARQDLQEFCLETGTQERTHFVGHLENPGSLLEAADLFVLPSEYEGQSNSLMEAILRRTPVVVSDIPGNRDLVPDSEHGWIFKMGDRAGLTKSIRQAMAEPEEVAQRSERAFTRLIQDFSLETMIQRYAQLYGSILETSDQP